MVSALSLRASAMLFTPSFVRKALPVASAVPSAGMLMPKPPWADFCSGVNEAPLIAMTLWNSPFDSGLAARKLTAPEPAEWPKMVTFFGSPPKAATFFCTHCNPATRSRMP